MEKLWDKRLHSPKQDVSVKKHSSRGQMGFAITSDKWVEYHKELEWTKFEKEDNIREQKIEHELNKSTSKKAKQSNKKPKRK